MNLCTINQTQPKNKVSILVVADAISEHTQLKQSLSALDYCIDEQFDSINLAEKNAQLQPDILIIITNSLTGDLLKQISLIDQLTPLPVLIFANTVPSLSLQQSIKATVCEFGIAHMHPMPLKRLINVTRDAFNTRQIVRTEQDNAKTQLINYKKIERAKRYIMQQKKINEQEALQHLKKMAINNGHSLITVANNVISVCNLLKQGCA